MPFPEVPVSRRALPAVPARTVLTGALVAATIGLAAPPTTAGGTSTRPAATPTSTAQPSTA